MPNNDLFSVFQIYFFYKYKLGTSIMFKLLIIINYIGWLNKTIAVCMNILSFHSARFHSTVDNSSHLHSTS